MEAGTAIRERQEWEPSKGSRNGARTESRIFQKQNWQKKPLQNEHRRGQMRPPGKCLLSEEVFTMPLFQ